MAANGISLYDIVPFPSLHVYPPQQSASTGLSHSVSTPAAISDILSASQPVVESAGCSSYVGFCKWSHARKSQQWFPSRPNSTSCHALIVNCRNATITPAPCRISISLYIDKVRVWLRSSPVEPAVDIKFEERKSHGSH